MSDKVQTEGFFLRGTHMDEKPIIFLTALSPLVLVPWPAGVIYEAQIDGLACYHERLEGVCLPLPQDLGPRLQQLHPGCCVDLGKGDGDPAFLLPDGLSAQEADALDKLFEEYSVPIRVKKATLKKSCEAWVHIHILPNSHGTLRFWGEQDGILTWQNCD